MTTLSIMGVIDWRFALGYGCYIGDRILLIIIVVRWRKQAVSIRSQSVLLALNHRKFPSFRLSLFKASSSEKF